MKHKHRLDRLQGELSGQPSRALMLDGLGKGSARISRLLSSLQAVVCAVYQLQLEQQPAGGSGGCLGAPSRGRGQINHHGKGQKTCSSCGCNSSALGDQTLEQQCAGTISITCCSGVPSLLAAKVCCILASKLHRCRIVSTRQQAHGILLQSSSLCCIHLRAV